MDGSRGECVLCCTIAGLKRKGPRGGSVCKEMHKKIHSVRLALLLHVHIQPNRLSLKPIYVSVFQGCFGDDIVVLLYSVIITENTHTHFHASRKIVNSALCGASTFTLFLQIYRCELWRGNARVRRSCTLSVLSHQHFNRAAENVTQLQVFPFGYIVL